MVLQGESFTRNHNSQEGKRSEYTIRWYTAAGKRAKRNEYLSPRGQLSLGNCVAAQASCYSKGIWPLKEKQAASESFRPESGVLQGGDGGKEGDCKLNVSGILAWSGMVWFGLKALENLRAKGKQSYFSSLPCECWKASHLMLMVPLSGQRSQPCSFVWHLDSDSLGVTLNTRVSLDFFDY